MGKGKGGVDSYVYTSKKNRFLLELAKSRLKLPKLKYFFQKAQIKLPGKSKFSYIRNRKEIFFKEKYNAI